jgi:NAD(P)H-dependent flavin oxidoreductase YrpB (nitropropane dioxygenase family)
MVKGNPENGILPSGQVAGLIQDLPAVEDLIAGIVDEAKARAVSVNLTVSGKQSY